MFMTALSACFDDAHAPLGTLCHCRSILQRNSEVPYTSIFYKNFCTYVCQYLER